MQMTQADSPSPSLPSPLTKLQEKRGCDAAHAQQSARRQIWCGAGVLRLAAGAVVHAPGPCRTNRSGNSCLM